MSDAEKTEARKPVAAKPRRRARLVWGALLLACAGIVCGVLYYVNSAQFHERVRRFIVAQMEDATGTRVELQHVDWHLRTLEVEFDGLVLHGREPAAQPPLLAVTRARGAMRWLWRGRRAWLRQLEIDGPVAHVMVFPDGTTNLPVPKHPSNAAEQVSQLIHLAIGQAVVRDGTLLWNDRRIRLDGTAEKVALDLRWNRAGRNYDGQLQIGAVRVTLPQTPPLQAGGSASFRIYENRIEVPRLHLETSRTQLDAGVAITQLSAPRAQFTYKASADLAEAGVLLRLPELSGRGDLGGQGTFDFTTQKFALVGQARGTNVTWSSRQFRLERVNGGFFYSLDQNRIVANSIFAAVMGGTAHGRMVVDLHSAAGQMGSIELETTGLEAEQGLKAFTTSDVPLSALRLSGRAAGPVNIRWKGSLLRAQLDARLHVTPVARTGLLPVTAELGANVELGEPSAEITLAEVSTPQSHLSAHGTLAMRSNLQVDMATADLRELEPMVNNWRGNRALDLPIEFAGSGHFRGEVLGRLGQPQIAGNLELHNFTTHVRTHERRDEGELAERVITTQWDALSGDVEYSASREALRNGRLARGNARIELDVSVPLVNGEYDGAQPFAAHVRVQNTDAADLQALAGSDYPISGTVNGEVQVGGTEQHLNGSGHLMLHDGAAWKQAVRSATADVAFTENQAHLRNILVKSDMMQLSGDAHMNVETREFGFNLKGTEVTLENLHAMQHPRMRVSGQATFEASGSGTPDAPVINGRILVRNLALNRVPLGAMNIVAVTHGAQMTLTARSEFRGAEVKLDGQVYLRDEMPLKISGDITSSNLNPWLQTVVPVKLGAPSELALHVEASGEARHPRDISAEVTASRLTAGYSGIGLVNDGPIRLRLAQQVLTVEQFRVSGEQGARFLQVRGRVELAGKREINLRANGSINLKLLETVDPGLSASGVADLDVTMDGTVPRPSARGRLRVQSGSLSYIDFPNGLSDVNGSLVFNEDRLQIQELTAHTGGGLLNCGGFLTFSRQGLGFNLTAKASGIRMRYPEGLSSTADADLQLTGSRNSALLSGNIMITRLGVNPQFDFANYLAAGVHGAPAQKIDSPLNDMRLDVHVLSSPELQVQTSLARLSGNVDLRLRGTAARPSILGRVNLLEGMLYFNGTKYRLERGDIMLSNPVRIEPTLDVELSARVRDYDITLGFHGPLNRLTPTYRSDPPLSSADIISLMALGRTAEEAANPAMMGSARYSPDVSESASSALVGQALSATVGSRMQKLFGVSRIKIDPNVSSYANAGLARVTVEQQVSNNVTLTYITSLNQSSQQILQFEYNINKNVTIEAVRDQNGIVSVDVLFRKRKR
ncbi:MAG: translocation/assembly module TamB domain-containing protein [Acidobacteriota bacterium]|nr:translocation/assembly module TamB domain-containing protein [Acidobacteriota bacterium]